MRTRTENQRLTENQQQNERARELRTAVISVLGAKCIRCRFDDPRALQVDHPNGGGRKQRAKFQYVKEYYSYILSHPEEFDLLCANCNWIKRAERKEYLFGKRVP